MNRKIALRILGVFLIILFSWLSYNYSTRELYNTHRELSDFRRMQPVFLPNSKLIELSSAGHTSTYADMMWISLIQYIGDNISNGERGKFLIPIIHVINTIHPHFARPYNIAINLSPILRPEKKTYQKDLEENKKALLIGEAGIQNICDQIKIAQISAAKLGKTLWDDTKLQNPCRDSMIAFNSAYIASEVGENAKSELYYKISSMNTDAPPASRVLGPLMSAQEGDHIASSKKFLLIAIDGYDEAPYLCRDTSLTLLTEISGSKPLKDLIPTLRSKEDALPVILDVKNPLATSGTNCKNAITRAMKQIYLAYIAEAASAYPEARNSNDLIARGLLQSVPTIREQDGWGAIKNSKGIWSFQKNILSAQEKTLSPQ